MIFEKYQVRKQRIQSYNLLLALLCIFFVKFRDRPETFNCYYAENVDIRYYIL